jgi:hypothetical protein
MNLDIRLNLSSMIALAHFYNINHMCICITFKAEKSALEIELTCEGKTYTIEKEVNESLVDFKNNSSILIYRKNAHSTIMLKLNVKRLSNDKSNNIPNSNNNFKIPIGSLKLLNNEHDEIKCKYNLNRSYKPLKKSDTNQMKTTIELSIYNRKSLYKI